MSCNMMNGEMPVWYGVLSALTTRKIEAQKFTSWTAYKAVGDCPDVVWTTRLFEAKDKEAAYSKAHGMIYARYIR